MSIIGLVRLHERVAGGLRAKREGEKTMNTVETVERTFGVLNAKVEKLESENRALRGANERLGEQMDAQLAAAEEASIQLKAESNKLVRAYAELLASIQRTAPRVLATAILTDANINLQWAIKRAESAAGDGVSIWDPRAEGVKLGVLKKMFDSAERPATPVSEWAKFDEEHVLFTDGDRVWATTGVVREYNPETGKHVVYIQGVKLEEL